MKKLTEVGYDPVFGARPLKRAIQQYIENPLAQDLLTGKFVSGDTIKAGLKADKIVFEKA
jgi:ATP-dependent Clp protease ATP-binding subunit ClpB